MIRYALLTLVWFLTLPSTISEESKIARELDFNFDWKFTLVEHADIPSAIPLDDRGWRDLDLPHDWSIEAAFSKDLEGATGYLPGGIGVYQKHFATPAEVTSKSIFVLFDGVYNNASFFLNGKKLGQNPYGYSPVHFELTPHLKRDGTDNVLTVHVDRTRYADSRWYTGSGIYRNVKLITVNKLHVPIWGVFVTTPDVSAESATVNVEVRIDNDHTEDRDFELVTQLVNPDGLVVSTLTETVHVEAVEHVIVNQTGIIGTPQLWGLDTPSLYRAITTINRNGAVVDRVNTRFGIRSIEFSAAEGFFLNGVPTLMKGVSLHHDGGLVGAAVPKGVWRRRLQHLKDAGANAVRTAHNPFSEEFLDLCDEMGLLVQNEIFDEFDYPKDKRLNYHDRHDDYITRGYTEHFQEWAESDLTRTVLRDRNHPSVVQWSIGNEIEWAYVDHRYVTGFWSNPNDPMEMDMSFWGAGPKFSPEQLRARFEALPERGFDLAETAHRLSGWVRALDLTRPVTANMVLPQVSHVSGYTDAVDIVGYSYRNPVIPWGRKHFPDKPISIHENPGTWSDWERVLDDPGVYSIFMWTGIDYIGERHDKWPEKSGWGDMLDLAGFKKQGWNYFKSIWLDQHHVSIGTLPLEESGFYNADETGVAVPNSSSSLVWRDSNMHWNYQEGAPILVEVSTNLNSVELFLNEVSLGVRELSDEDGRIMRWVVPFASGQLVANSAVAGTMSQSMLETTSSVVAFRAVSDKTVLQADGYDVAHVTFTLFDEAGRRVRSTEKQVTVEVTGAATLLGVDNGAPDNVQGFQTNRIETHRGRALAILKSTRTPGPIEVTISSEGLATQVLVLDAVN